MAAKESMCCCWSSSSNSSSYFNGVVNELISCLNSSTCSEISDTERDGSDIRESIRSSNVTEITMDKFHFGVGKKKFRSGRMCKALYCLLERNYSSISHFLSLSTSMMDS